MTTTVRTAAHTAMLDPIAGAGLLLRPAPGEDLRLGRASLQESDWGEMVGKLYALGWEPLEDDWGMPLVDQTLSDGREVVGLSSIGEPIQSRPSLEQLHESITAMMGELV